MHTVTLWMMKNIFSLISKKNEKKREQIINVIDHDCPNFETLSDGNK